MDIGIRVSCQNCLNETYMYHDTHGCNKNGDECAVAGRCPTCSTMLSAKVGGENIDIYPPWKKLEGTSKKLIGAKIIPYYAGD